LEQHDHALARMHEPTLKLDQLDREFLQLLFVLVLFHELTFAPIRGRESQKRHPWPHFQCSSRRGRRLARLHGLVRESSCAPISFSHAVRQAEVEPGRQNTNLSLARPANARDCKVEVPISSYDSARNISPNPGIPLSSSGRI